MGRRLFGPSSPGHLLRSLEHHVEQFMRDRDSHTHSIFIYYRTHYMNDFRQPEGYEPLMSRQSRVVSHVFENLGYEIFDANQLTKSRPESTNDGLHYNSE